MSSRGLAHLLYLAAQSTDAESRCSTPRHKLKSTGTKTAAAGIQKAKAPALSGEAKKAILAIADETAALADYIENVGPSQSTLDRIDALRGRIVEDSGRYSWAYVSWESRKSKLPKQLHTPTDLNALLSKILWLILPYYQSYQSIRKPNPAEDPRSLRFVAEQLRRLAGISTRKGPVSKRAGLILEKLRGLPEHEGMTTSALLSWLSREHKINIDDGTLRRHLNKELKPYGCDNHPKYGYFIRR